MRHYLIDGDPLAPSPSDLIAQVGRLPVGQRLEPDGWRVLTGNTRESQIARVVMRYEVETAAPGEDAPEDTATLGQLADEYDAWLAENWPQGLRPGERDAPEDVYMVMWAGIPDVNPLRLSETYAKLDWLNDYMVRCHKAEQREAWAMRGED